MAPHLIEPIEPVVHHVNTKGQSYWQSGFVTNGASAVACAATAERSRASLANIPKSLQRIPWC